LYNEQRSYDQEETELMNGGYDQQKSMRIKQLEELVDELKNQAGLDQLSSFEDRGKLQLCINVLKFCNRC
jgi:hypothetical protein